MWKAAGSVHHTTTTVPIGASTEEVKKVENITLQRRPDDNNSKIFSLLTMVVMFSHEPSLMALHPTGTSVAQW